MAFVKYSSNNSGGHWWLTDSDWKALESAGWVVVWHTMSEQFSDAGDYVRDPITGMPNIVPADQNGSRFLAPMVGDDGRWLGALARSAYRPDMKLREAADEWERITGKCATDAGCPCCGQPHDFTEYDDKGRYVTSGPSTEYSAAW